MLELISCSGPGNKRRHFSSFDPAREIWVVSDLQSKWHLQRSLLQKDGRLEEASVMRATELWKSLAFQLRPETRLLSVELAQTLFWNWIEPRRLPWARSPRAVPVLLNQMNLWMSLFADPNHADVMAGWFSENQDSYVRWGHWFELCEDIWRQCEARHLAMVSWLPALLASEDLSQLKNLRPMYFDLGPQISQVEGLLIRELSRELDIKVFVPEAPWIEFMPSTLKPYADFLGARENPSSDWQPPKRDEFHFGRFSTQLAEVKDAVANVRRWLDNGVSPQKIAIVAPDIEDYWPALRLYFEQEGIPVSKPTTTRLADYPEIAQWVSALRTRLGQVQSPDLEVYLFTAQDEPRLSCDRFRVLFSQVYDQSDLKRAEAIFQSDQDQSLTDSLRLEEFLSWAFRLWSAKAETSRLVGLLQLLGQEVPRELALSASQWLAYIEGLLVRREIVMQAADENGIWCISLSSANWLDVDHAVFLNLVEESLRSLQISPMSAAEAGRLFTDTGYALGSTDRQELEFECLWFWNQPWRELRLSLAGTDFQGKVLTPSRLWMWTAFVNERLKKEAEPPEATRWDEIQRLELGALAAVREMNPLRMQALELGMARDRGEKISTWKAIDEVKISASSLKRFWDCPFIFAAERQLKLSDEPVLDLDLDHRTRGSLLHAVVEELMQEPVRWDWSESELAELIDCLRMREEIQMGDGRFWPAVRAQHVRLANLFLTFEREWRERFPKTVTVGRELGFECFWDLQKEGPTRDESGICLSGRIDRVDGDGNGQYVLIDYKSGGQLRNWQSWLDNHEIQLAFYALLLEEGLAGIESGQVVAANYFVIKNSDRRKGFHVKDIDTGLFETDFKHRNFLTTAEKENLFKELKSKIQSALQKIMSGELNPDPRDQKVCTECVWRTLCRAPHLN